MKERVRKSVIMVCVIFFAVFSSVAYPIQQASAGPAAGAVPGGIVVGTGVYVGAALATAGIAGFIGYDEYSEEINSHAQQVWSNGTQLAKDSLTLSVNAAKGAGNTVVNLQGDFINFMESKLDGIAGTATEQMYPADSTGILKYGVGNSSVQIYSTYTANKIGFQKDGTIYNTVNVIFLPSYQQISVSYTEPIGGSMKTSAAGKIINESTDPTTYKRAVELYGLTKDFVTATTLFNYMGESLRTIGVNDYANNYANVSSRVREAWESMRDAGLVLPVDSAIPYSAEGQPLRYDPSSGVYTGIDGGVYTGVPSWRLPNIKWREKSDSISVPGVYVDTPVLTGNPEYDKETDIPNTTTNIFTGTTIANPDIATGNPAVPTTPPETVIPPFDAPGSTGLDFTPLMMTGETMMNKFPFSIPFDFVTQLQVLNVEPEAPKFDINIPEFIKIGGWVIPFKMNLSFEMFDPVANIIRWGMIVIFDISLIFSIRKLLPE